MSTSAIQAELLDGVAPAFNASLKSTVVASALLVNFSLAGRHFGLMLLLSLLVPPGLPGTADDRAGSCTFACIVIHYFTYHRTDGSAPNNTPTPGLLTGTATGYLWRIDRVESRLTLGPDITLTLVSLLLLG